MFSKVTKTSLESFDNISEDKMKEKVIGSNIIFIDGNMCSEQDFNDFISDFGNWSKENKWWNLSDIILLNKNDSINNIKKNNYDNYMGKQQYNLRFNCYVTFDGKIEIY